MRHIALIYGIFHGHIEHSQVLPFQLFFQIFHPKVVIKDGWFQSSNTFFTDTLICPVLMKFVMPSSFFSIFISRVLNLFEKPHHDKISDVIFLVDTMKKFSYYVRYAKRLQKFLWKKFSNEFFILFQKCLFNFSFSFRKSGTFYMENSFSNNVCDFVWTRNKSTKISLSY